VTVEGEKAASLGKLLNFQWLKLGGMTLALRNYMHGDRQLSMRVAIAKRLLTAVSD